MNNSTLIAEKLDITRPANSQIITVFTCANSEKASDERSFYGGAKNIKMACSAMVRDVFLLRAFEAGAQGVLVVGCSPDRCKRQVGSTYAQKRVEMTRKILEEIGLGSWRLVFTFEKDAVKAFSQLSDDLAAYRASRGLKDAEPKLPYVPGDYAALQDKKYRKT